MNKTLRHPSTRSPRWTYSFSNGIAAYYKGREMEDIDQGFDRKDWVRGWVFAKAEDLRG